MTRAVEIETRLEIERRSSGLLKKQPPPADPPYRSVTPDHERGSASFRGIDREGQAGPHLLADSVESFAARSSWTDVRAARPVLAPALSGSQHLRHFWLNSLRTGPGSGRVHGVRTRVVRNAGVSFSRLEACRTVRRRQLRFEE